MRADRSRVRVGETFHLAIHVRVAENVSALDELVTPNVGTLQILGDERSTTHGAGGSDVVETLTLSPVERGRVTFAPAYLDAIDARDGKAKRFSSQGTVTVVVDPPGLEPAPVRRFAVPLALLAIAAFALGGTAWAVIFVQRTRRRRAPAPPPVVAPPPPREPPTARQRVAAALGAYRVAPNGVAIAALRAELFAAAGASPGATLRDALERSDDGALRAALDAAERVAFGPAAGRGAASRELVDATERWLG